MRFAFLESAESDLRWFRSYYTRNFPEGRKKANAQLVAVQDLLLSNPFAGQPLDDPKGAREFPILRTPFSIVYRVRNELIEVLRVVDNRSDWRG